MTAVAQAGQLVGGRYRLISELGSGGFGRVWKAHDETLDVHVAVKELRLPRASSPAEQSERLTRAAREARNAAALRDHPNIVAVHDVIIHDEIPWIVMRLVDGHSVDEMIRSGGPLPAGVVTDIAVALLRALDAAHRLGIVHRDVKPGNVMMARTGEVLLADFGIAVQVADTALTATGVFVGSVEYVAPERLRGQENTAAGDLFSLGATLYHAIEGASPFRRDDQIATLGAVLVDEVAPPRLAPPRLAAVITRLLAKDATRRPTVHQALAMLTDQANTAEPPVDGDRAALLAEVAGAMKLELARRIGQLAGEHGITFTHPAGTRDETSMMKPGAPRTPTARVAPERRRRREKPQRPPGNWRHTTGLVLMGALLLLGVFGAARYDWDPRQFWSSFQEAFGSLEADSEFGGFLGLSALPALFLALAYGLGIGLWVGKAVASAGGGATVMARLIFGLAGFAFGAMLFYCTVRGGADLLGETSYQLDDSTALWVAFGVVVVVQFTAQIWSGEKKTGT